MRWQDSRGLGRTVAQEGNDEYERKRRRKSSKGKDEQDRRAQGRAFLIIPKPTDLSTYKTPLASKTSQGDVFLT